MPYFYQLNNRTLTIADDTMDNRALAYGDGFFSTLGIHQGQILWLPQHKQRLELGVERFCLDIDIDSIMHHLRQLAQTLHQGILKIIITRTPQMVRGYGFNNRQAQVFIKTMPTALYDTLSFVRGFAINKSIEATCLSESIGIRPPRFWGLKLISSHEQVFAHHELLDKQKTCPELGEGLVKNIYNTWVSGTMSNVFYRLNNRWHTPPIQQSGVAGVARSALLSTTNASERMLMDNDLPQLTGLFFCNAVRGIIPVSTLWTDQYHHHLNPSAFSTLLSTPQ